MEDFLSTAVNVTANRGNSLINRKMILRILGILLFMEAMMFLACAGVSLLIVIVLVRFRLNVVSGRIHYVGQPGDQITGDLSVLYAVHQVTWQSVVHHP